MASERESSSKLSETLSLIEDVKQQGSEINRLLDLIEQRRNKLDHSTSSSQGTGIRGVARDDEKTQVAIETSSRKSVHENHATGDKSLPSCEDTVQDKPRGILKSPKLGSKDSYGFIEQFDLNENNVMYGSQLRRKYVQMNQDNRLCLRFGFEPNLGCRYSGPTMTGSPDQAGNKTMNKTKSNIHILSASGSVRPSFSSASSTGLSLEHQRSHPPQQRLGNPSVGEGGQRNMPNKMAQVDSHTTKQQVVPSTSDVSSNDTRINGQAASDKRKETEMEVKQKQEEVTSNLTQEHLKQLTGLICGMSNKLLKPLGVQLEEEQVHEMSTLIAQGLSDGDFTIEDHIPTGLICGIINKLLKPLGVQLEEEQVHEMSTLIAQGLSDGDFTIEDHIPMQEQMNELRTKALKTVFAKKNPDQEADRRPDVQSDVEPAASKPPSASKTPPLPKPPSRPKPPSPVQSQTSDSEYEGEPVYMDIVQWSHYAESEKEHGKYARDIREKGMDTIFCLDVSSSMKGVAWEQAKEFIRNFIEGIQNTNLHDSVYEHVALVTFGGETRVQQHLTCDYLEITRKLDGLKPEGPSPLYAGLQMCQAAVLGAGAVFNSCGYKMHPRIYLITDGKATAAGLAYGPDKYTSLPDFEEDIILSEVKSISDKLHTKVYPIPVGSFELPLLEKIARVSEGKIVSPNDWTLQSKTFKNYLSAARIKRESFGGSLDFFQFLYNEAFPGTSTEDMAQMLEFLASQKQEVESSDDDEISGLPPLGSRVRRSVAGKQLGTVTKHFTDDHVGVTWDEALPDGSIREKLKYKADQPSLSVLNEPRLLRNELIALGCRVRRGPDWRYSQQDGGPGKHGNVFDVEQNGIVKVRWDNGNTNSYRFGAEGKFDVEIVPDEGQPKRNTENIVIQPLSQEEAEKKRIQELNDRNKAPADIIGEALADNVGESDIAGATGYTPSVSVRSKHVPIEGYTTVQKSDEIIYSRSRISRHKESCETLGDRTKLASRAMSSSTGNVQWMWQDGEQWVNYPPDVNEKIESNYLKHPTGTCVIQMQDQQFRIAFSQMKQINMVTRVKIGVKRSVGLES